MNAEQPADKESAQQEIGAKVVLLKDWLANRDRKVLTEDDPEFYEP
jgi:hypothetical protein